VPIFAILGTGFVVVSELFSDFTGAAASMVVIALGMPLYYYLKRKYRDTHDPDVI
jgi:hypothetical protein